MRALGPPAASAENASSAMGAAGHAFPAGARASDVFDFRHNEDFRSTRDTGQVLRRGGEVYELPYGYQRFAVGVKGKYDSGNNTWLRNSGGSGEWAVASALVASTMPSRCGFAFSMSLMVNIG